MKPFFVLLVLSAAAFAGDTFDDMLLRDGTVLKNVEVKEITGRGLKVTHKDGSGLIKTEQLPAEVKKRYGARIAAAAGTAPADKPGEPSAKGEPKPEKPAEGIPGLEPTAVVQLCEKQGLTLRIRTGGLGSEWTGSLKDDTADIDVTAAGPNKESMAAITATVVNTGTASGSGRARTVCSAFAALSYTGAEPAKAKQWIGDNIDIDDAKTTIGGVTFHISAKRGAPNARSLRIAIP